MNFLLKDLIKKKSKELKKKGFKNSYNEIIWYLEHYKLLTRTQLQLNDVTLNYKSSEKKINYFFEQRISNIPFQHIIGKSTFYGRDFYINNNVLIPRPESELFFQILKSFHFESALDIGTGSGNLAITLSLEKVASNIDAIDFSLEAIKVAKHNAAQYKTNNIKFYICNILETNPGKKYDLIISNPPYISYQEYLILPDEIQKHEPKEALTDNFDGLVFYKKYAEILKKILNPSGMMLCEFGACTPFDEIAKLFHNKGFTTKNHQDYNENNRIIQIKYG